MQGAATQAMSFIVEERQRSICCFWQRIKTLEAGSKM
jgi:hypothetical protein